MKKILKRFLLFGIAASLVCSSVPTLADVTDYKGTLSDYKRTFSESEDVGSYINAIGSAANSHFQSLYDDDGNMVLKLGGSIDEQPASGYNSGGAVWSGEGTERIKLEFKVKRDSCDDTNHGGFCVYGSDKDVLFMMQGEKIYFLGNNVSEYKFDTWYDIYLKIDFSVGYACLSVKKSSENEWFTVSSAAAETKNVLMTNWKKISSSVTSVSFSHYRNTKKDRAVTYIDDLVTDTWTNKGGAVDFLEDNFNSKINTVTSSSNAMNDSGLAWLVSGAVTAESDGAAVLSVGSAAKGAISKKPFYGAPSARQRIRFKLSVPTNSGTAAVSASFNNPTTQNTQTPLDSAQSVPLLKIYGDKIILGDSQHNVSLSAGTLYDCEIVYSAEKKIVKAVLTDTDGTQYTGSATTALKAVFGADADWGYLAEFALSLEGASESSSTVKFDDFDWDLGLNSSATVSLAEGQSSSLAPLDACILFTFGETVDSAETIGISAAQPGSAVLTVLEEGEEFEASYTLEWVSGGTLKCTLDKLSAATSYSVSLDGVALLSGESTDEKTITFDTMAKEVDVSEPEFINGTLSVDVSTGYTGGKPIMLIVLEYDETGVLTNARILEKRVGLSEETLSISSISGCSKIGVMVWENFITQKPYTQIKIFDVAN